MKKFDIFISYRRRDAGEKAEHLKDLLEQDYKGRVSFDRENLTGIFDVALVERIDNCKDFILVLGKHSLEYKEENGDFSDGTVGLYRYLASCTQEAFDAKIRQMGPNAPVDFVRIEIARALNRGNALHIIPVVPERTDTFNFSALRLPPDIADIQRREAVFYSDNPDALFKDVVPKIKKHLRSKQDVPARRYVIAGIAALLVAAAGLGIKAWKDGNYRKELEQVKSGTVFEGSQINWLDRTTLEQAKAVKHILDAMVKVDGGTFMMGAPMGEDGTYDDDVDPALEAPQSRRWRQMNMPLRSILRKRRNPMSHMQSSSLTA